MDPVVGPCLIALLVLAGFVGVPVGRLAYEVRQHQRQTGCDVNAAMRHVFAPIGQGIIRFSKIIGFLLLIPVAIWIFVAIGNAVIAAPLNLLIFCAWLNISSQLQQLQKRPR